MEPLEIRDRRYRLQKEIKALEAAIKKLQAQCPHEHREEVPEQGLWRCKDCDLRGKLEPAPAAAEAGGGEAPQQ